MFILILLFHHFLSSLLQAAVILLAALPRLPFAQHNLLDRNTAPIVQMTNYSRVPHGEIPEEEFMIKDGQTYDPFSGLLKHIEEDIKYHKHKKWGFLIYRCDYASDEAWAKFLSNLNWEMEEALKILKAEDLRDTMEMTPKEDKEVLDGATVDQVRNIFTEYTFCVHFDADVLDAVVNRAAQPPTWDPRQIAYVNMAQLRREDFAEELGLPVQDTTNNDDDDEEEEEEDRSEYGDQNFVKVPLSYLGPEFYNELYCRSKFERWVQYQRSDGVSFGGGGVNPEDVYGPLGS